MSAKLLHKRFDFKVDEVKANEDGTRATFKGFASAYGNKDLGGDIVAEGAFAKAVKAGKPIMVLADHTATVKNQIGFGFDLDESKRGLGTTTELNLEKEAGRETYAMLKHAQERGYKVGLSIGFSIDDYEWNEKDRTRTIKEASLWEYSVVIFPMNPKATVTAVKSILESGNKEDVAILKRGIEAHLREARGFSKTEAEIFVSGGWGALGDQGGNDQKAAADAIAGLAQRIKNGE
jgi:HK97 family phage prohead protease